MILPPSRRVGRYELQEVIGVGAMGVVFAAHDPELGRRVAVKILRAPTHDRDREQAEAQRRRFIRESRSLARIVHPNVVSIYDVGEVDDEIFIAMELVEGTTLREWLAARQRTTAEILALFEPIGRGLLAVHQAGLVHRDFKPENILIGADGRPRVTDFGVAFGAWSDDDELVAPSATSEAERPSGRQALSLTATGALLGTPSYMALEQLRSERVDGRADLFAFAVTLWEALFGVRPFAGASLAEMGANIYHQRFVDPGPRLRAMPRGLVAVLTCALAARPEDRQQNLDELLLALRAFHAPPVRRRSRIARSLVLVAVTVAAGVAVWGTLGRDRCRLASFDQTWMVRFRPAVLTLVGSAKSPAAIALAQQTLTALDRYARRLDEARQDVCEATFVQRRQSEQTFDAQSECLLRRQRRLELLVGSLKSETMDWRRAVELAASLDDPGACRSATAIAQSRDLDAKERARLLAEIDRALDDLQFSRFVVAAERLERAIVDARHLGDDAAVAEALLAQSQLRRYQGDREAARVSVNEAIATALTARSRELAFKGYVLAVRLAYVEDAERLVRNFEWLRAATGAHARHRAQLYTEMASVYRISGRKNEALGALRVALAEDDVDLGAHASREDVLGNLLWDMGYAAAAGLVLDRAAIDAVVAWGEDSHEALSFASDRVAVDFAIGGPLAAIPGQRRLVARAERSHDEDPELFVMVLNNLVAYLAMSNQDKEALATSERAVQIAEAKLPAGSPARRTTQLKYAAKLVDASRFDEAIVRLEQLVPLIDREASTDHATVEAVALNLLLAFAYETRDPAIARRHLTRMQAQAKSFPTRPDVAGMRKEAAELEQKLARGRR